MGDTNRYLFSTSAYPYLHCGTPYHGKFSSYVFKDMFITFVELLSTMNIFTFLVHAIDPVPYISPQIASRTRGGTATEKLLIRRTYDQSSANSCPSAVEITGSMGVLVRILYEAGSRTCMHISGRQTLLRQGSRRKRRVVPLARLRVRYMLSNMYPSFNMCECGIKINAYQAFGYTPPSL